MPFPPGRRDRLLASRHAPADQRRPRATADRLLVDAGARRRVLFETLEPRLLLAADALGLAAAYAFDETSGTTAADATSNAIVGTLTNGPTWTIGKYGNAVNLDGINDYVNLGSPALLQMTGSMTVSGWVNAASFPVDDAAVVSKRSSGELGFQLDVTKDTGQRTIGFKLTNSSGGQMFRFGATTLQTNTWYHIAGVYDAATQSLHVYLNGVLDDGALQGTVTATQQNSTTTNVAVGRRAGSTGFEFAGRIDDVRLYSRALTTAEIQADMLTSLGAPDTVAPSAPTGLTASPFSTSQVNLSWTASTDNVAVTGYQVFRNGNQVGTSTTTTYSDTGLSAATTYSYAVRALDAAGNVSVLSAAVNATTPTPDTTAPTVALSGPAPGTTVSGTISVSATASDNVAVAGVQFLLDGVNLAAEDGASPYSVTWNTAAVANGSHTLLARARDAAGNVATSAPVVVTVANTQTAGLTAGYAFNETSGTTAADASSNGIAGTLVNGPVWGAGRYGNGLTFDGVNDYVNLGNPTALRLTGSMTISAWVNASVFPADDAAVVSKRASGEVGFQLDLTKDRGPRTIGFKLTNSSGGAMFRYGATTLQANTWYHITGVYDAAAQSLHVYLNGVLDDGALQGTVTATQQNSTANVNIGRRAARTGFEFAGRIDDVRIYNRALSLTEIQADMLSPLGAPDTVAPSVPTGLSANPVSTSQINLTWTGSTDNVAVTGYQVFRNGTQVGTATGTSYSDTGLAAGTAYGYAVRALDAAGNLSLLSATITATTPAPDTVAPAVSLSGPAAGSTLVGTVTVSANASDNVGVAGVQFLLDGAALVTEDITAPYSISWSTTTAADGPHTLAARARDAAGNTTTSVAVNVVVDNQAPTGTVLINGGAAATNNATVTLALSASDALTGVTQMRFSNTGTTYSAAEAYAPTKSWTLAPGDASKSVFVQFMDAAGNWSVAATDTIVLDTTAPTMSAITATSVTNVAATITWVTNETSTSRVEFGTTTSYGSTTPLDAALVASHSVALTGLVASTTYNYRVRSVDAAGNESVSANATFSTAAAPDSVAPSVSLTAPAGGASVSGTITISANASDNVGVAGVQFLVDGTNLGVEDSAAPYSVSWNTTGVPNGSHNLLARARDAAGNVTTSSALTITVANVQTAGLTAAYAFDETAGTTAADASGNAIVGTLTNGPTWTTGKYGNAVNLDGVNDYVNLGNPAALQVTGSMTLSGWVNAAPSRWTMRRWYPSAAAGSSASSWT